MSWSVWGYLLDLLLAWQFITFSKEENDIETSLQEK